MPNNCEHMMRPKQCLLGHAGDFADLKALVNLKTKYHFLLVIDEAHATLVCGTR